ncbi:MAG: hypothetical protein Q8O89_04850 [Nanoarchaeota archaeon]|nr:hypothetical protein [Nanoarchaeota archaeon]
MSKKYVFLILVALVLIAGCDDELKENPQSKFNFKEGDYLGYSNNYEYDAESLLKDARSGNEVDFSEYRLNNINNLVFTFRQLFIDIDRHDSVETCINSTEKESCLFEYVLASHNEQLCSEFPENAIVTEVYPPSMGPTSSGQAVFQNKSINLRANCYAYLELYDKYMGSVEKCDALSSQFVDISVYDLSKSCKWVLERRKVIYG